MSGIEDILPPPPPRETFIGPNTSEGWDRDEFIVKDALMKCDKGSEPSSFNPTHNATLFDGRIAGTIMDKEPGDNIPSFGNCSVRKRLMRNVFLPCDLLLTKEWQNTGPMTVGENNEEALSRCSYMQCDRGGTIKFVTSGSPLYVEVNGAQIELNMYYHKGQLFFSLDNQKYFDVLSGCSRDDWDAIALAAYLYAMKYCPPSDFSHRTVVGMSLEFSDHYHWYKQYRGRDNVPGFGFMEKHSSVSDVGGQPADIDAWFWEIWSY